MTGLRGGKNPKRETVVESHSSQSAMSGAPAVVESHSCAKNAQEWATRPRRIPSARLPDTSCSGTTVRYTSHQISLEGIIPPGVHAAGVVRHVGDAAQYRVVLYSAWRTDGSNEDPRMRTIDGVTPNKVPWRFNLDTVKVVVERIVCYEIVGAVEYRDTALFAVENAIAVDARAVIG